MSLVLRLCVFLHLSSDVVVIQHLASSSWFLHAGAKCIPLYGSSSAILAEEFPFENLKLKTLRTIFNHNIF